MALPLLGVTLAGATRYPIQVWKQSDDGLTSKLAGAIEDAVRHSKRLRLSTSKAPRNLYLQLSPVLWRETGAHTRITYFVGFARSPEASDVTAKVTGTCWDYQMEICAAAIVKEAEAATRNSN